MNILFLCDEYPPCRHGGIGSVTRVLARELVKKGHHVIVCGLYPYYRIAAKTETDFGVRIYRQFYGSKILLRLSRHRYFGKIINVKKGFNKYISFIKNVINEQKIDIVEMADYQEIFRYTGPEFIEFPDFGVPKIVKIHGGNSFFNFIREKSITRDILYFKEKKLLDDASLVLAISKFSKNVIKNVFDYRNDIKVIYNGIELDTSHRSAAQKESNIVVFAGTIAEKKGIFSLVKSWGKVITAVPDATLLVFGKGSRRSLKQLDSLINEKTRSSIYIKGFAERSTLKVIYSTASCAIFPSYAESFGMAPLEAMEVECPTIFTRRASGPELIEDEVEGLLVDPDNTDEISSSIIYLLKNRKRATEIGKQGAEKVRSHFDIKKIADQHLQLYDMLILKERP